VTARPEEEEEAYVAFVRTMLDDLAAGRSCSAAHYARLYPACAARIREELGGEEGNAATAPAEAGPAPAPLPASIGAYAVAGELAAGGMGRLLLARHPGRDGMVVIKSAKAGLEDPHALARLRREARILSRLEHEGVCPVIDILSEGGQIYVVMPFIEGETLEARIRRAADAFQEGADTRAGWRILSGGTGGPDPAAGVLAIMEEVARAVHAVHQRGIVHTSGSPSTSPTPAPGG
jgi:serine/threonine protein kinase